jgi:hypothetical protein
MLFFEEVKGPVGALCEINGYVAHSMGQKVRVDTSHFLKVILLTLLGCG